MTAANAGNEPVRWAEISETPSNERLEHLSKCLEKMNIKNELSFYRADNEIFPDALGEACKTNSILRMGPSFYELVMESIVYQASRPMPLAVADSLKFEHEKWFPHLVMIEVFRQLFSTRVENLDITRAAFVVGTGAPAWAALVALTQTGFRKISFTDQEDEGSQLFLGRLKAEYFDVEFRFIPSNELSFLPGNHSVVVNTLNLNQGDDLYDNLCNYNFLSKGGAVIDFPPIPDAAPHLHVAEDVGAQVIFGYDVAALYDFFWVKEMLGIDLDDELLKDHEKLLEKIFTALSGEDAAARRSSEPASASVSPKEEGKEPDKEADSTVSKESEEGGSTEDEISEG